jgi:hypothetical protein
MSSPEDLSSQNLANSAGKKAVHVKVSSLFWSFVQLALGLRFFGVKSLSAVECEAIQKGPLVSASSSVFEENLILLFMDSLLLLQHQFIRVGSLECDINL